MGGSKIPKFSPNLLRATIVALRTADPTPPTARLYPAPFPSYGGSKIPKFSPNLLRATIVALPAADPTPPTARLYTAPFPSYGGSKIPKFSPNLLRATIVALPTADPTRMFGSDWCDLWHSVDVLASTASILNLSMISLDRYWAITNPIAYPSKMSTGRACVLIALVWICSASISFPAIIWWRTVASDYLSPEECMFTDDRAYLLLSSVISFYTPIVVIMFAYYKIYKAATEQTRSLKTGCKVTVNGSGQEVMTLRMHRGGRAAPSGRSNYNRYHGNHIHYTRAATMITESESDTETPQSRQLNDEDEYRPTRMMSRKWGHFALSKKLSKLAKEQKAAKTLGIVMGVFCICWVPFFVTNLLFGLCHLDCVPHAHIVFPVFNWLGYINSGMNPIIYALSMRDFRRAFTKVLCCCPFYRRCQNRRREFEFVMTSTSYTGVTYNEKSIQSHL